MINLTLSQSQASDLRHALSRYLSDLSMEIADTDSKDYREGLKKRRESLKSLLDQLTTAAE